MKIKRKGIVAALFIVIFIYLIALSKNLFIKSLVTQAATQITGADVRIKGLSFDILGSDIRIIGLKMYNPKGFPREILLDIPKVEVEYDLSALLKKRLHLTSAEINLKELVVVKDKEGKLNINSLKFMLKKAEKEAPVKQETQKNVPMHIDVLKLNIGRVIHKDFSIGEKPQVVVYDINIDKTYKNITNATQLITLMLTASLESTAIKGAQVYGIEAMAGIAVLPLGVASILTGKDSAESDFAATPERAYKASLNAMDGVGDIIKADEHAGYIKGQTQGAGVVIRISQKPGKKVNISVSARKYILPKPKIAEGVLYEISQKLK